MKLYVCMIAMMHLKSKDSLTRGKDRGVAIDMPNYFYILEHEKGLCLVDCGVDCTHGETPVAEGDPISVLSKLGYTPDDVRYVIMTHMHIDHTLYMSSFPKSTFIIRKSELKMAWWHDKCEGGYCYDHYKDTRDFHYIQLPDDVDFDVFGDGTVVLTDTRGHSAGHQSVLLNLPKYGKIMLTGDAASLEDNLRSMLVPGFCTSIGKAEESLVKIQHYEDIGYELFYAHEVNKKVRLFPEYYE